MATVRDVLKKLKPRVMRMRLPFGGRSLYYQMLDSSFVTEEASVANGISSYLQNSAGTRDQYILRRNIHMIEKGLSMRPRRPSFGVGYIKPTVAAFARQIKISDPSADETRWYRDVLSEYFAATAESKDATIAEARAHFAAAASADDDLERLVPRPAMLSSETVDIDRLIELAQNRRSVRWFTPEPIDRGVVEKALSVGLEAPTACNRQPFRMIVIDDPELRREVAAIPMGTKGYAEQLPGLMVVVGDLSAFFSERDRHLIYIDGSLASMGVIFGFESQGIATCCINWPDIPEKEARMRAVLNLAPYERVVMLLAFGHPDTTGLAPHSARKPVRQLVEFVDVEK